MLLGPIERRGQFEVGPRLAEIAGHQLPGPEYPVADQARRRGRLQLREREKLLCVFQRPLGVSSGVVHPPDAVPYRIEK
jgi:hypothetical protein